MWGAKYVNDDDDDNIYIPFVRNADLTKYNNFCPFKIRIK